MGPITSALAPPAPPAAPSPPDPCDMGALLRAALTAADVTPAEVARRTGIAPSNVSRALHSADTRPVVARRILAAVGMRLAAVKPKHGK